MTSTTTPIFRRQLTMLAGSDRDAARRAYRIFRDNPRHPSLRFKKLSGFDDLWSVRINLDLRAVAHRSGEHLAWVWIGHHNDFDNVFG